MRLADYVMNRLYEEKIRHIFTVTGWASLYLTDALARHKGIEHVCLHHEASAGFAANAYAQYKNGFGVCLTSVGPAATNAITACLNAWSDKIPTIYISGQKKLKDVECEDIIPMVEPITRYAVMLRNPKEIAFVMDKALYYAGESSSPVWIDIPIDLQNARIDPGELEGWDFY